ncbi:SDR family NAD(P)-dependent oxidoreductase [Seongchinamella sediminis]|uniref:SDR family NAD(P)-dependent oxidoreductase n=1 Tax=Seongchinamella sediminis TaxID=2283635 RepID=A0A3L7E1N8_9GAMM|nr:SDR family oxidoreductase [Seongchinamella sediminis]RLQ22062.1 SDR family NAD(P)-dependent oxidoreductase [Seongchinamella sediminis]
MMTKTAFITGASRGIGAEAAVALARHGYRVAITARTLAEGEQHDHLGSDAPLPGSLQATAAAVQAVGGEALCLQADILDEQSVIAAAETALAQFGHVDLLFNNAVYQGDGNQSSVLDVAREQLDRIYQGNVFTPLALVKTLLPGMLARGQGTIINMVSYTAFNNPPAPADKGGWGFAYPSSKAALARMAGALRAEHADSGVRIFNMEPGTVVTEAMKAAGVTEEVLARFKPCTPQAIAAVVNWLAENEPHSDWRPEDTLAAPAIAKQLDLLKVPSLLGT